MMESSNNSDRVPQGDNGGAAGAPVSVLVVGAGPTGLLLASELERRGVRCHLIDARPGPLHWDRATVVHPRSLQIFLSRWGLLRSFLRLGAGSASSRFTRVGNCWERWISRPAEAFMDSISACPKK